MKTANPVRAMLAGFLATVAITTLIYAAPWMGMPEMDIAGLIGWWFTDLTGEGHADPGTAAWWLGMFEHFLNGAVVFPLMYVYLLYPLLPGRPWLKGMSWGVVLFVFAQIVVVPLVFCLGLFTRFYFDQQLPAVLGSLGGHLVYGLVFGLLAGEQAAHFPWPERRYRMIPAGPRP